jgi:hypothetical protein
VQGTYTSFALFQCYTLSKNVVYRPFYWLGGRENILGLIGGLGAGLQNFGLSLESIYDAR